MVNRKTANFLVTYFNWSFGRSVCQSALVMNVFYSFCSTSVMGRPMPGFKTHTQHCLREWQCTAPLNQHACPQWSVISSRNYRGKWFVIMLWWCECINNRHNLELAAEAQGSHVKFYFVRLHTAHITATSCFVLQKCLRTRTPHQMWTKRWINSLLRPPPLSAQRHHQLPSSLKQEEHSSCPASYYAIAMSWEASSTTPASTLTGLTSLPSLCVVPNPWFPCTYYLIGLSSRWDNVGLLGGRTVCWNMSVLMGWDCSHTYDCNLRSLID